MGYWDDCALESPICLEQLSAVLTYQGNQRAADCEAFSVAKMIVDQVWKAHMMRHRSFDRSASKSPCSHWPQGGVVTLEVGGHLQSVWVRAPCA